MGNREDKDVLVLTYHPALSNKIYRIINRNQNILSLGLEHRALFPRTPVVAFRKPKSLKDILVREIGLSSMSHYY